MIYDDHLGPDPGQWPRSYAGASSTGAWLRARFRIRPGDARRLVNLANAGIDIDGVVDFAANVKGPLTGRELPTTIALLRAGRTSPEHVAVVYKILQQLPKHVTVEQAQAVEQDMAGFCAEQFDPVEVAKLGAFLLHLYDADTLDDDEGDRHRRRELRLDPATGALTGRLTTEGMALLSAALDPLAAPEPGADGTQDPRTAGQRLADALVELARRMLAAGKLGSSHGMSHKVMISIALDTLFTDHTHADSNGTDGGADGDRGTDADTATGSDGDQDMNEADGAAEPGASDPSDNTAAAADRGSADADGGASGGGAAASGVGVGDPGPFAHPADATDSANDTGGHGEAAADECPIPECAPGRPVAGVAPGILLNGQPISAAAVRRITCMAGIQRVILNPDGVPLDVGRECRTVTPAQFAALIARDRGCAFPGCTRPPAWCVGHHIIHWVDGGNTDLDNLVLLCTFHHTVVHHRGWTVKTGKDRLPDFIPPAWVDPEQKPQRNPRPTRAKPADP